jgi:hypothetical protein
METSIKTWPLSPNEIIYLDEVKDEFIGKRARPIAIDMNKSYKWKSLAR